MTDRQYHHAYPDAPPPTAGGSFRRLANGIGAILSLALVGGMLYWGYQLAVRDVSGVPVVRALEGPMRVAPENPGGMQAAYQGLSVNSVAAHGLAAPLPESVTLAPDPPDITAAASRTENSAPAQDSQAGADTDTASPDPTSETEDGDSAPSAETAANDSTARNELPVQRVSASLPGVSRSPIPQPRPEGDLVAQAAAQAVRAALTPAPELDIDPDSLEPGQRLVQLGAFDSAEEARTEWERIASRHNALLDGKGRLIQSAEAGGRVFYRLRVAGFNDEAETRRFCAVILADDGGGCIPVLVR